MVTGEAKMRNDKLRNLLCNTKDLVKNHMIAIDNVKTIENIMANIIAPKFSS